MSEKGNGKQVRLNLNSPAQLAQALAMQAQVCANVKAEMEKGDTNTLTLERKALRCLLDSQVLMLHAVHRTILGQLQRVQVARDFDASQFLKNRGA